MKIKRVEIKNFRNITKADIDFANINVFTGKNSSGKSNLLLALSNILKTKGDYTSEFGGNNVTIGPGRKTTTLKASVLGVNDSRTCFIDGPSNFFCVEPEVMVLEKVIDKNSFSLQHRLFFTGKRYRNSDPKITWQLFTQGDSNSKFEDGAEHVVDELVYEKKFQKEEIVGNTNIVQKDSLKNLNEEEYLTVFHDAEKSLVSQIKPKVFSTDLGQITNALSIHRYVTDKGNEQIYSEALKRGKEVPNVKTNFDTSEFIFLIADIERNKEVKQKFFSDLGLYTKGIVTGISINQKGSLSVLSPNGPDGIWTISNGTSVLVFIITLINWINLNASQRSYRLPHVLLLDETDSIVHPTILPEFIQLLRNLSRKVQIFITTHSPYFLDGFSREEIYYIKDAASMAEVAPEGINRCNIYSYEEILKSLSEEDRSIIANKKNSELFCDAIIENLFPVKES